MDELVVAALLPVQRFQKALPKPLTSKLQNDIRDRKMATGIGSFTDALAFGALNDVLSLFHDENAYGRPNQYEVQILPIVSVS